MQTLSRVLLYSLAVSLVSAGASANQALFDATRNCKVDDVKNIIKNDSTANTEFVENGYTPLMVSAYGYCEAKAVEIAALLIGAKADVNAMCLIKDRFGYAGASPLIMTTIEPPQTFAPIAKGIFAARIEIANMLIKAGAQLEQRNALGETALLSVMRERSSTNFGVYFREILQVLLGAGADANAVNEKYSYVNSTCENPLFCAIRYKHPTFVKPLIDAGARVNKINPADPIPKSPLGYLAAQDSEGSKYAYRLDIAKQLIAAGAHLKDADLLEETAREGNTTLVELLISEGAAIGDALGKALSTRFIYRNSPQSLRLDKTILILIQLGAPITENELYDAVKIQAPNLVDTILATGFRSNGASVSAAISVKNLDLMNRILKTKPSLVSTIKLYEEVNTHYQIQLIPPLYAAMIGDFFEAVPLLLQAGANPNTPIDPG
ncbi:MAG: ankyrin repeat domain-containing protein, partial [Proteobacteria bacterium]